MNWQAVAERAAKSRCAAILSMIQEAIADHAPDAHVHPAEDEIRVRGRSLRRRWLSEPGLRFARRITG